MEYGKPELKLVGNATEAVRSLVEKGNFDCSDDPPIPNATCPAYEADE